MTSSLRIALAQTTFLVGHFDANLEKITALTHHAAQQGADVIIFPELAITGYPVEDLLLRESMADRVAQVLDALKSISEIIIIVGHPAFEHGRIYNAASIIYQGKIKACYHKQCLPDYGVFDEDRYFSPGQKNTLLSYHGCNIGLLICEDIWESHPTVQLKAAGADLVLVLNASPFAVGKQQERQTILAKRARENGLAIAYVNLVGAQDDLIFDGGSMAFNPSGELAHESLRFEEQLSVLDYNYTQHQFITSLSTPALSSHGEIYHALVVGLREYVNRNGFTGVVFGLSGGIDSAFTAALAVDALGADRVHAVMMPYHYTADISIEDAHLQAQRLGIHFSISPIHSIVEAFTQTLQPYFGDRPNDTTEENLQARARGTLLMALSNKLGLMVLATGNKSEMAVGYATLYGDMVGGYAPIKDVYKTLIFELARFRNSLEIEPVIPLRVIERPPTAELRADQLDQDSLPPYDILDAILQAHIEDDLDLHSIVAKTGFDTTTVERIIKLVKLNEYKRKQSVLGTRITTKAFTRERRYPITSSWPS